MESRGHCEFQVLECISVSGQTILTDTTSSPIYASRFEKCRLVRTDYFIPFGPDGSDRYRAKFHENTEIVLMPQAELTLR